MHTVAFFDGFASDAKDAGMTESEVDDLVDFLSENPMSGSEIRGTGGCRKMRWPKRHRGKRGGYRIVTFYTGVGIPVFLVTVFSKGEKSDLTRDECNGLHDLTKAIVKEYQGRVTTLVKKGA